MQRPRLRRPAAVLVPSHADGGGRPADGGTVRPHPRGRVSGHQQAPGRHPAGDGGREAQHHGRRRRRAEHLRLPRCDRPQHPRLPETVPRRDRDHAGAELPQRPADPRRGQRGHRARAPALYQESVERAPQRAAAVVGELRGRGATMPVRLHAHSGATRGGRAVAQAGGAGSHGPLERHAGSGDVATQHSLPEIRRPEVPGGGAREGPAGVAAVAGEPARPGQLVARAEPAARCWWRDGQWRAAVLRTSSMPEMLFMSYQLELDTNSQVYF